MVGVETGGVWFNGCVGKSGASADAKGWEKWDTLIWFQNRELKKKQKKRIWVNFLPAYQAMESLLFDMLITGFTLLTVALGFGFFTIDNFFAQHLAHKTAFSIVSWFVYGSLLIGHYKFGWRGQKAIRFTLIGFFLLAVGFIGSKFVLEMILHR